MKSPLSPSTSSHAYGFVSREFIAYGLATCVAFAADLSILSLLVGRMGVHYALAAAASFLSGAVLLYWLSIRFVFRYRRVANRAAELGSFVALGIAGVCIQTVVMMLAVERFELHYLVGKLAAAGCTFVTNYLLRRTLLFSRREQ